LYLADAPGLPDVAPNPPDPAVYDWDDCPTTVERDGKTYTVAEHPAVVTDITVTPTTAPKPCHVWAAKFRALLDDAQAQPGEWQSFPLAALNYRDVSWRLRTYARRHNVKIQVKHRLSADDDANVMYVRIPAPHPPKTKRREGRPSTYDSLFADLEATPGEYATAWLDELPGDDWEEKEQRLLYSAKRRGKTIDIFREPSCLCEKPCNCAVTLPPDYRLRYFLVALTSEVKR
jgi:hypothetical protein